MYKLIRSLPLAFLVGCAIITPSNASFQPNAQLSQRDLQNPATTQPGIGFVAAEVKQLLEFCIELNNQDDLGKSSDPQFEAKPEGWKIVYDSRHPGNTEWNKKWPRPTNAPDPNNPESNGFGPFNNAWLLLQSESDPNQYAIAIRGTVGETRSIIADALITTTSAQSGIKLRDGRLLPITFASTPKAELHLGFTYAAFTMLFEKERGILRRLRDAKLPDNAKLFITGHSQGAAIATLVHSFLYYAITDPADRYKLNLQLKQSSNSGVQLKSYLFAQPKPGNLQYAEDFARIAKDLSYAINNDLDPVPQVPLSLQVPSEVVAGVADENRDKGNLVDRLVFDEIKALTDFNQRIRNIVAQRGTEQIAKRFDEKKMNLDLQYFEGENSPLPVPATSLNYILAGQLIPLFGLEKGGNLYPIGKATDVLLHHHATSYRKLIQQQIP
jgi:Lipase (class 3)